VIVQSGAKTKANQDTVMPDFDPESPDLKNQAHY